MYLQYQFSTKCADKRANIIFYSHCTLYVLSTALAASDVASQLINVRINSVPSNDNLLLSIVQSLGTYYGVYITASVLSGCCDFIAQSILVRINHAYAYHLFIHPNFQRSTAAGLCGIAISVSSLFPPSSHSHS